MRKSDSFPVNSAGGKAARAKRLAIFGSAAFLIMAPGSVAGLAPWWISHWQVETPFFGMPAFRFLGVVLIVAGVIGLLDSFSDSRCRAWARQRLSSQPAI